MKAMRKESGNKRFDWSLLVYVDEYEGLANVRQSVKGGVTVM
jgi:hypothetical protein